MSTEEGSAGAGRGRGNPLVQPGASDAPGVGAGRGKVGAGSLFSRILEKPKERVRREPSSAAGESSAQAGGATSETGPGGSKVYRSRADSSRTPLRFADASSDRSAAGRTAGGQGDGGDGDRFGRSSRARAMADMSFGEDTRRPAANRVSAHRIRPLVSRRTVLVQDVSQDVW